MVQDVGATFGPQKLSLEKWSTTPIWANASSCLVSMRALPYGGGNDDAAYSDLPQVARSIFGTETGKCFDLADGTATE